MSTNKKKRILIVEDELIIANDIRGYLSDENYEITSVVLTGEDAINMAKQNMPDLVIMDILLHGNINGIEAAEEISKIRKIPIIFVSAYSHEEIIKQILSDIDYEYILKPFQAFELIDKVNSLLEK
jgi:CheY-like chemotaxis protein